MQPITIARWPRVPRLAADDPARGKMAANLAAHHLRTWRNFWPDFRASVGRRSLYAAAVYEALAAHCNRGGECYPTRKRLAMLTGIARPNVSRARRQLERAGYVVVIDPPRRHRAMVYYLPDIRAAVIRAVTPDDPCLREAWQPWRADWRPPVQTRPESTRVADTPKHPLADTSNGPQLIPQSESGESDPNLIGGDPAAEHEARRLIDECAGDVQEARNAAAGAAIRANNANHAPSRIRWLEAVQDAVRQLEVTR